MVGCGEGAFWRVLRAKGWGLVVCCGNLVVSWNFAVAKKYPFLIAAVPDHILSRRNLFSNIHLTMGCSHSWCGNGGLKYWTWIKMGRFWCWGWRWNCGGIWYFLCVVCVWVCLRVWVVVRSIIKIWFCVLYKDGSGWFYTGDLGYIAGRLHWCWFCWCQKLVSGLMVVG